MRKMRICNRHFARSHGNYAVFPEIRLSGRWLEDSGFEAGQYIHIAYRQHEIVITLVPEENDGVRCTDAENAGRKPVNARP